MAERTADFVVVNQPTIPLPDVAGYELVCPGVGDGHEEWCMAVARPSNVGPDTGRLVRICTETSANRGIVHRITVITADAEHRNTLMFNMEQDYAIGVHRHMVPEYKWLFYIFETRIDSNDIIHWNIQTHFPRNETVYHTTFSTQLATGAHTQVIYLHLQGDTFDQDQLQSLREEDRATYPRATVLDFVEDVTRSTSQIMDYGMGDTEDEDEDD
jgi:hypothetical protein